MRFFFALLVAFGFHSSSVYAEKPKADSVATCTKDSSLWKCAVDGSAAEIPIVLSKNGAYIELDEAVKIVVRPKARTLSMKRVGDQHIFFEPVKEWKGDATAIVATRTMSLTLKFSYTSDTKRAASQVRIVRSDRAALNAEVEARVSAKEAELERALDTKARRLALERVTSNFLKRAKIGNLDVRPNRQDFIVIRPKRLIRHGDERTVEFSLDCRKRDPLKIGSIAVVATGKTGREIKSIWECEKTIVRFGTRVRCVATPLFGRPTTEGESVRVLVKDSGGKTVIRSRELEIH